MMADYEDLPESEAGEIYVKRFPNPGVLVKEHSKFPCAK